MQNPSVCLIHEKVCSILIAAAHGYTGYHQAGFQMPALPTCKRCKKNRTLHTSAQHMMCQLNFRNQLNPYQTERA